MGKPFAKELNSIVETIKWGNSLELTKLSKFLLKIKEPVYLVGSGGSLSACHFAVMLLNSKGKFARAITPLELFYLRETLSNSTIIFISASGKNYDIKFGYKLAIEEEPKRIGIITMKKSNPLVDLATKNGITSTFSFSLPSGKDGFLATNSLIAFYLIFNNAITDEKINTSLLDKNLKKAINNFVNSNKDNCTYTVLYSSWNKSVALDIESKCSEAGLSPILISDYRNFGHGRHNWFDKKRNSAIIALSNEEDFFLAEKTLKLIPNYIPKLFLKTKKLNSLGSIDLLIKSFLLINELGIKNNIDPGKPGVPDYGSKLYNLSYSSLLLKKDKKAIPKRAKIAIKRKLKTNSLKSIDSEELIVWKNAYNDFVNNIKRASFGLIMFDYDGTLCSSDERYTGPSEGIKNKLINILDNNFYIGIATGRGKSARIALQKLLPKKYWQKTIIGYYNGSDCGTLDNNNLPNKETPVNKSLEILVKKLKKTTYHYNTNIELRPNQITIKVDNIDRWRFIRNLIVQTIKTSQINDIQILESSHSMDIIPLSISKLNVVDYAREVLKINKLPEQILCIGDKGQWAGNDFMLLDSPFGLSVDEVSSKLQNCWNIATIGKRNTSATLEYLDSLSFSEKGIKFNLR